MAFAAAVALSVAASAAISDPVRLDSGMISGTSGSLSGVRVFKGIPFAAPPVGDLRWRAPQPVKAWEGVRKADQFGPMCMQGGGRGGRGGRGGPAPRMSEDCLYLNIWTAAASSKDRRPVMVWIHPGGYTSGSGASPGTDGDALAQKGVVLVTINYRLGVFGFFSYPELTQESDRRGAGNQAFMDQTAALRWVQKNIAGFGGDPKNVTVFGDSAGSASIANLMASPQTKGLFRRAIGESGAWMGLSVTSMRSLADAEKAGTKTAESLNAHSLAELRALSAEKVLRAGRGGGPVIDGWFLPEDVGTIFAQGKQAGIPILVGSNQDEGTFFSRPTTADAWIKRAKQRFGDMADQYLKLYPAGSDAQANASELAAFRDELGWVMRNWARLQTKTGKSKAYLYYFTHQPPSTGAPSQNGFPARGSGATHGSEAQYVFQNLLGNRAWTPLDRQVSNTLSSYWVNFAANGNPNGKGVSKWTAFNEKNNSRMVLGDEAAMGPGLSEDRVDFFQAWYDRLAKK
ncbi:MAG TPA: carboxylesterase family protein [Bryobacteraceae bacterium]|nr:carboxylesterase family protein [Bryobacteraceae bacterium]